MENPAKRDRQTIRLMKWIKRYPGWWALICTGGDGRMTLSMMKMLTERLAKEEFYEIILVMLTVHRKEEFMDSVFKTLLLEMIITGYQGKVKSKGEILRELTSLLT